MVWSEGCACFQELYSEEDFQTSRWLLAEVNVDKPGRKTNRTMDVEGASVRIGVWLLIVVLYLGVWLLITMLVLVGVIINSCVLVSVVDYKLNK